MSAFSPHGGEDLHVGGRNAIGFGDASSDAGLAMERQLDTGQVLSVLERNLEAGNRIGCRLV